MSLPIKPGAARVTDVTAFEPWRTREGQWRPGKNGTAVPYASFGAFCDDLIEVLDDATSETYYAQLVESESTRTVMAALKEVIEKKGRFCALYSDRASHFFETPKAGGPVDLQRLTQVGRALKELGIQMIPAYSPQARGSGRAAVRHLAGLRDR